LAVLVAASEAAPEMTETLWSPLVPRVAEGQEHYVAPEGKAENAGTKDAPWDIGSALGGKQRIAAGSIIWLRRGRYVYPVRNSRQGGNGFKVNVGGAEGKPVHVRAVPGERVTIDGGFDVAGRYLWLWDLEFALADDWRPREPAPQGANTVFNVPTGVLNITGGTDVRIINCVSHHNTMGVGFWKHVKHGEIHGCIIYDNGFVGADRPHGPALYTQNQTGTPRLVTDNIIGGNFSLALQCYGSKIDEMVNDFVIEGNIEFAPRKEARGRTYNQLGGRQSRNMVFKGNFVYGFDVRLGTEAGQTGEGNVIVRASYNGPTPEKNTLIRDPAQSEPVAMLRPNKYDPRRANLVVSNWSKAEKVEADLGAFLKKGDKYRIMSPLDFYGRPLAEGVYDEKPVGIPMPEIGWELMTGDPREVGVFVVLRGE